ncbi:MAG: hypothetical protein WCK62_07395, partial [Actinomycetes bacterium]
DALIRDSRDKPQDCSESGSAIIEFLIFALPLFLPLTIFFQSINHQAQIEFDIANYARQLARAYVSSPAEAITAPRLAAVQDLFTAKIFSRDGIDASPSFVVACESSPCLSPNAKVEITVTASAAAKNFKASAIEYVDAWR